MKRILNNPNELVYDMAKGFIAAYSDKFEYIEGFQAIKKKRIKDKVIVMPEGGSGLEPWCIGYLGDNLGDACCIGNVFTSPSAYSIYETSKMVYNGKGIVFIFGNFAGDYLNHDMAVELLEQEGIKSACIILRDDIASAPKHEKDKRGGIAGLYYLTRCVAAATELNYTFEETVELGNKLTDSIFTIPVVLDSGTMPDTGEKMFEIEDGCIEFGLGFNGEPGIKTLKIMSADKIVDTALDFLFTDMSFNEGEEICVLINSMGALTFMEQHIIAKRVNEVLKDKKAKIYFLDVAEVLTSQDMRGFSVTFMRLNDEIKQLYDISKINPVYMRR